MTRRLVDVAQDSTVSEVDCGTTTGLKITALREGHDIRESIAERVLGRVSLDEVKDPKTGEVLVAPGDVFTEEKSNLLVELGIEIITARSPLTCESEFGVCAKCYGRDLATGRLINVGEAVGVIAAQSIGEPGTQLTMRTFHFGGTVTHKVERNVVESRFTGRVEFVNIKTLTNREGRTILLTRNGEIRIFDKDSNEARGTYPVPYGAFILVKENEILEAGAPLAEWDPFAVSIIATSKGLIKYVDLDEGRSVEERVDEITFLTRKVVIEAKGSSLKPSVEILSKDGSPVMVDGKQARFPLPVGAQIFINNGDEVQPGDIIAKIPREASKTKDITGGLPRVAELFEARKPKDMAVLSEVDGTVSFGADTKGKRKVVVTTQDGENLEYLIPKGRHVVVTEGDYVRKGEAIVDGAQNPHDILAIMGMVELASYLVAEVQEVYKLQGVKINDKHIEVIVKQMLRRVRVLDRVIPNYFQVSR